MAAATWGGKPALFHHRNGDGAIDDNVGHGTAGHRTEERRRHHRNFSVPAAKAAHEHERNIGEKLIAADCVQRLAEKDESDDDAGRDIEWQAENAAGI